MAGEAGARRASPGSVPPAEIALATADHHVIRLVRTIF
jgi:hypothetical protein